MENKVAGILEEVTTRVNERADELLVLVLEGMSRRESLAGCQRHDVYLVPYTHAQIKLTRARRIWRDADDDWYPPLHRSTASMGTERYRESSLHKLTHAAINRDIARSKYRSTPCTCWVTKR